jgi:uncharacterized protein YjbI with pentapeptide repeats
LITRASILARYAAGERNFRGLNLDCEAMDFSGTVLVGADFSESFIVASFRGANLAGSLFERCNVKTCDFSNANLEGASFSNSAIDGAEFAGASLVGASFEGATELGHVYAANEYPLAQQAQLLGLKRPHGSLQFNVQEAR